MVAPILAIVGALALLANSNKATPLKWVALLAICLLLLAGCSAGGADSYYSDTPGAARPTAKAVPLPTASPTLPPALSKPASVPAIVVDDYIIGVIGSISGCLLGPVAFFYFTYAIGGPIMRRYGLPRGPQDE